MFLYWKRIGYGNSPRLPYCPWVSQVRGDNALQAGIKWEDANDLGHRLRYYKATEAHLARVSKCMHGLYMSDEGLLKDEVKEKDSKISVLTDALDNVRSEFSSEMEAMKRKIDAMEKKYSTG